jgi:hypothetical protein
MLMAKSDKSPNARRHELTNEPRSIAVDVTLAPAAVTGQPLIAFEIHG